MCAKEVSRVLIVAISSIIEVIAISVIVNLQVDGRVISDWIVPVLWLVVTVEDAISSTGVLVPVVIRVGNLVLLGSVLVLLGLLVGRRCWVVVALTSLLVGRVRFLVGRGASCIGLFVG